MKLITLPLLAVVLLAGCSAERTSPAAPASTVTVTATTPSTSWLHQPRLFRKHPPSR